MYDNETANILKKLRCIPCASNENVYDSNSNFSIMIRNIVENYISEGKTEDKILEDLVSVYGNNITYNTVWQKETYILWSFPFFLLLLGVFILYKTCKIK